MSFATTYLARGTDLQDAHREEGDRPVNLTLLANQSEGGGVLVGDEVAINIDVEMQRKGEGKTVTGQR